MASSKGEFKHESVQDRISIVKYLAAVCEGIQQGRLTFNDDDREIVLEPIGLLNLELKAKRSDNKTKLALKLSWQDKNGVKDNGELVIHPEKTV
jgi:amphi-Trp domain-containing protein